MKFTKIDEIRFWSKIRVTNSNESCWYWTANTSHNFGYGTFRIKGITYLAHRLALIFYSGKSKNELQVNHKCNNPSCCNPSHLYWGTQKDNVQDSIISGTKKNPPKNNTKPPVLRGEDNKNSVMSENNVLRLRYLWSGGKSSRYLSRLFGISISTVYQIVNYKSWKHI